MENVKEMPLAQATNEEPTPEQVEISKEELAKRRKEITDYYKDNIKHLKTQLEYEELLMNIEKTRAERVQAQIFLAQATQGGGATAHNEEAAAAFTEAQGDNFDKDALPKRTLKRTE